MPNRELHLTALAGLICSIVMSSQAAAFDGPGACMPASCSQSPAPTAPARINTTPCYEQHRCGCCCVHHLLSAGAPNRDHRAEPAILECTVCHGYYCRAHSIDW